jgi:hypothetical protein
MIVSLPWSNCVPELSSGGKMSKNDIRSRVKSFSKRLPDQAQDEYYDSPAARLDTLIGGETRNFARIQQCKKEWDQLAEAVPVGQGFLTFEDYIREYYGIRLTVNHKLGGIDLDYVVVDQKKYTVFLLKFGA